MLVLGIESSTPQASVAIGSEQGIVAGDVSDLRPLDRTGPLDTVGERLGGDEERRSLHAAGHGAAIVDDEIEARLVRRCLLDGDICSGDLCEQALEEEARDRDRPGRVQPRHVRAGHPALHGDREAARKIMLKAARDRHQRS